MIFINLRIIKLFLMTSNIVIVLLFSVVHSWGCSVNNEQRLIISIYKYSGLNRSQIHEAKFYEFEEIISSKLLLLPQELIATNKHFEYVSNLRKILVHDLYSNEHVFFTGTNKELHIFWDESNSLEVLLGRVRLKNNIYSVRSNIYLGDLKGNLDKPSITLDLPIIDEQFDTTRDSHTIVTLYALAMDAINCNKPPWIIQHLLSEAYERLSDIPDSVMGIKELKKAIFDELIKLRIEFKK